MSVGGFLFGTALRSRNLRGEKLFEKLLSAQVVLGNLRGEKLFEKLLSAQVSAWWPFRACFGRKRARNGTPTETYAEKSF